jgi:pilus assembly protein CpaE
MERTAAPLTALLIAPDRELAQQFAKMAAAARAFQVLAELKSYPSRPILEMRLRQLQPDVVLLDLASDFAAAEELIRLITQAQPETHVVGLHRRNDSEAILRSLRLGASEFLYAPFDPAVQAEAVGRLRRLRRAGTAPEREPGKVVVFASAKPGSGASTLAVQTALALRRLTNQKILIADLDLTGGSLGFYLRLESQGTVLEALEQEQGPGTAGWRSLVEHAHGLDVLTAPPAPSSESIEATRLHDLLEGARRTYDWTLLDLPSIFHRTSLLALAASDDAFLVTTSELPSLHLARKAVNLLGQLGFPRERYRVLVNRVSRRDTLKGSDMEKIFNAPVHASIPNDGCALDRAVTLGQPLGADGELGRAVEDLARRLAGVPAGEKRRSGMMLEARPAFSES